MNIIAFIKERAKYYNCPVCGTNLRSCEVSMLRRVLNQVIVQVTCRHCQVAFEVVIVPPKAQLPPPQHPDGQLPRVDRPISTDDLIDLHHELAALQGSLADLTGRRPPA